MGQPAAYPGNHADCTQSQAAGTDNVVDVCLVIVKDGRCLDETAQKPDHDHVEQYEIPVVLQGAEDYGPYLASALMAEFPEHLECAAATGVGEIDCINKVGQYTGRSKNDQEDTGEPVEPIFLLEMEREHEEHYIQRTQIHDAGCVKDQRALEHGPQESVHGALQGIPVVEYENGMADKERGIDDEDVPYHHDEGGRHYRTWRFFGHFNGKFYISPRIPCLRSWMCSDMPQYRNLWHILLACSMFPG